MPGEPGAQVNRKPGLEEHLLIARRPPAEPARGRPAAAKDSAAPQAPLDNGTWQASSFDLAQGLDVKVMNSKLSPETLDRLFRA
jgi:hypothetical protein